MAKINQNKIVNKIHRKAIDGVLNFHRVIFLELRTYRSILAIVVSVADIIVKTKTI